MTNDQGAAAKAGFKKGAKFAKGGAAGFKAGAAGGKKGTWCDTTF